MNFADVQFQKENHQEALKFVKRALLLVEKQVHSDITNNRVGDSSSSKKLLRYMLGGYLKMLEINQEIVKTDPSFVLSPPKERIASKGAKFSLKYLPDDLLLLSNFNAAQVDRAIGKDVSNKLLHLTMDSLAPPDQNRKCRSQK